MTDALKKFLLGASILASVSTFATAPAQALSINFDPDNFRTYRVGNTPFFTNNDPADAISALTDGGNSAVSNVELWYTDENPTANVGFTAKEGDYTVKISSVTQADWANFGEQWLNSLLSAYGATLSSPVYDEVLSYVTTQGIPRSGDPNIGQITLTPNGKLSLDLIGHYNLAPLLLNPATRNSYLTGNQTLDNLLLGAAASGQLLQMSEVAKVSNGGKDYYAYSFSAVSSGISSSDGTESFTGIYKWDPNLTLTPDDPTPPTPVPEPATLGGLLLLGGLLVTRRQTAS